MEETNSTKILVVVDLQNDFVTGALGTQEAQAIVPRVCEKIRNFPGPVYYTQDTHGEDYLSTAEGRKLPVPHCIKGSEGWQLHPEIAGRLTEEPIDKPSFGSVLLPDILQGIQNEEPIESITLVGLCTDICVISNAMILKAYFPEIPILVDASCCAGVTPQSHANALEAMKMCQIEIEGEGEA